MNNIRVTYSGLISLILGMINIPLGFTFMLIVTRTLSTTEYGTWGLISGIIVYATIIEPMISYWTIREVARNEDSAKTSVLSGWLFSLLGIIIYLISAYFISGKIDTDQNVILLGSLLIPLIFSNRILHAITIGWRPQGISYAQIIFGVTQIPVGFTLIYFLKLGTSGVIYSVSIAYAISIIFLLIYTKEKIQGRIKKEYIVKWIKFSWLTVYPALGGVILFLDVAIFSIITKSVIGLAFWTASLAITTIIVSSGVMSVAIYSKLLEGKEKEFLPNSLRHLFYFSILFTALVITFAKPGLFALNPEYASAELVVIVLAVQVFLYTISGNLQSFITGIEKVDTKKKSTFQDYLKSKLFFIPTLTLIQSSVYVILLTVMLLSMVSIVESQIDLILYWAIIGLIVQIPISIYTGILFKKNFSINLDIKNIGKYFVSAIISFGITQMLINSFLEYNGEIIKFLPQVILFIIFFVVMYVGITIVIDSNTRILAKAIISEIKK
jgi:O-antigen/teichoic acid export membrane protein